MASSRSRQVIRSVVAVLCLFSCTLLVAQSTGGRILGRVADPSGAVIGHAAQNAAEIGRAHV